MFLVAMHLMYKRKKNPQTPIPSELPPELRIPAYEGEVAGIQSNQSVANVSASFQGEPKMQMSSAP